MQKLINDPQDLVSEMLDGILLAHGDQLRAVDDPHSIVRVSAPVQGKVGIVTGGGSGHLPLFLGYVGEGLLDGVAVGDIFASPTPDQILEVTKEVDSGAGVLYLYGNYGGDLMNFDLGGELAELDGHTVRTVVGRDDVASAPKGEEQFRRGIAGLFLLYKVAGAKAAAGAPLDDVVAFTERAAKNLRSFGVALSPMVLPAVGKATFDLPVGQMEIGMGIHGEQGIARRALQSADEIADELLGGILADIDIPSGSRVAVLVNGLGATPAEELYVIYRRVHRVLADRGISIYRRWVGEFVTSLEMAGASLSILVLDDELAHAVDAPVRTPFFEQS
ncbi:dihydroxyacetone kinase subunit DhaK [Rhodococcoides kyotonense]|uniref:Dihydroxyacetone kinase/dihydroxyacetone kinase, N-terminal domain n=1 Tax=Rhodococcoides kyotonense TaxID=398843 RepID=A0A239N0A4_9NOCA|nr:dihydroxyacetone kinase subunit DhaK [Rhodococcus kyotonensis]SNT47872.1 dihydroxyacetone kinase/dihydroxyacetone kinase, N-terminal domain [Rhodococcus kyotonensis]